MSRNRSKSKIRTAKGRKTASTRWLQRQLNDPYVSRAKDEGYRSRAAYKLKEIDEKLDLLKPGMAIIDLGAAPGGWSQVAIEKGCGPVVALDILEIEPIEGVEIIQMDFMDNAAPDKLKEALGGPADIVMSDIAPNTIGHKQTDHLRIMAAVEAAAFFAQEVLKPGGVFIAKVFQGGAQNTLVAELNQSFGKVRHIKPPASRKESSEQYLVASDFKG